jgi:hypothetical protein
VTKDFGRWAAIAFTLPLLGLGLAACTSTPPAVEPVTKSAEALQGQTVDVPIDSTLNIITGALPVTDYNGVIGNPSIAKFIRGSKTSSAQFDPAIKPLALGKTMVTLTTTDGSGQYVTFTLDVVTAKSSSPAS